jgi:molybdopterin-containing oxidoreductase family iron-sulfur binding subunit
MKRAPYEYKPDETGRRRWQSLADLAGDEALVAAREREFPEGASEAPDALGRRRFLSLMGASLALGGLAACRRPEERILPYSRAPEEVVPGRPLFFATTLPFMGTAFGVLVESHEGRPTRIEGNPRHPESLGAATTFVQSSILDLYDPDRSASPLERGAERSWDDVATLLRRTGADLQAKRGKGLAILTEAHRSPSLAAQLQDLGRAMPEAMIVRYDPFTRDAVREGAAIAFGRPLEAVLDVEKARVIVALDADLLATEGSPLKQARGFASTRSADRVGREMSRLYAVESGFSLTGAAADHRLRLESAKVPAFLGAVARELSTRHGLALDAALTRPPAAVVLDERSLKHAQAIAADLASHRGQGLLVAGRGQPAGVHALVHLLNQALGNVGRTVRFVAPFDAAPDGPGPITALAEALRAGRVGTLLVLGGNPAFDAPADARFAEAIARAPLSIHVATHVDETSRKATWHLNRAHALEAWGDARAEDGTASVAQPLIAPLLGGRTDLEVVDLLLGRGRKAHAIVEATWRAARGEAGFDKAFRRALHDGLWSESASPAEEVTPVTSAAAAVARALQAVAAAPAAPDGFEVTFHPDFHAWDGRFANNGWLQELADPMTKLTWGNAALISAATAKQQGLADGDVVALSVGSASIEIPVVIAPGQADRSVALTVGQGRSQVGRVGTGVGVDVGPLRMGSAFFHASGASLRKTGAQIALARTQEHFVMEGRPLAREGTLEEFEKNREFAREKVEHPPLLSLWKERAYEGHAWGMAIDLGGCIGCNACVTACQAENNIPVVGADGVRRTREMHWIRIDRYFEGESADEPTSIAQPTLCQHCENAPCEQVCPVGATVHSPEGLNDMVYNRCVGTRYCANNCPYKVRRFNFLDYTQGITELGKLQINPDVTVRSRGVMEKCTFCVQRINHAKIDAKREGRDRVHDGEITTACEQACPTRAITFGDLNDPKSRVAVRANSPLAYKMLEELNIKPRVSYLARVKNPNPDLEGA